MSYLHDIAEAVKSLIDSVAFSKSFDARFVYDTNLTLEDVATLHVDVVAAGLSSAASSRSSLRYEVLVDIGVRYRFGVIESEADDGAVSTDEIGPYLELLEEIAECLADPANRFIGSDSQYGWAGNEIRFPWVPDHLRTNRQYTGILQARYTAEKDF